MQLSELIKQCARLASSYNIYNTIQLLSELQHANIDQNTGICSFDISNMYTNIPTLATAFVIQDNERQGTPAEITQVLT
jgi:hypothetical protein